MFDDRNGDGTFEPGSDDFRGLRLTPVARVFLAGLSVPGSRRSGRIVMAITRGSGSLSVRSQRQDVLSISVSFRCVSFALPLGQLFQRKVSMNSKTSQGGFTLIELVVVITILGILAAFAVPRFASLEGQARTRSDAIACRQCSVGCSACRMRCGSLRATRRATTVTMEGQTITMVERVSECGHDPANAGGYHRLCADHAGRHRDVHQANAGWGVDRELSRNLHAGGCEFGADRRDDADRLLTVRRATVELPEGAREAPSVGLRGCNARAVDRNGQQEIGLHSDRARRRARHSRHPRRVRRAAFLRQHRVPAARLLRRARHRRSSTRRSSRSRAAARCA